MQLHVTNSPFRQEQADLLNRLLPELTEAQRMWLCGYLAAWSGSSASAETGAASLSAAALAVAPSPAAAPAVASVPQEATILFGSQTGNSQRLAKELKRKLDEQGVQTTLSSMSDYKPANLKKTRNLLIVVSTHGEGDPPDNALTFHEFVLGKRAPQLEDFRFSVLALGDSSYEFFCKTGKDFDQRLEELGGKRLAPRVDCDVDYDEPAAAWIASVVDAFRATGGATASAAPAAAAVGTAAATSAYSRSNPFYAEVLANVDLNGRGSQRETRHLELSLEGSGLSFEPGDCLGIYPENHPELVDRLIAAMGWQAETPVVANKNGDKASLREALLRHYEITVLTKPLLEQAAKLGGGDALRDLLQPEREHELRAYLKGRDLLDLAQDFGPWQVAAADFVAILRKLPARLYSIASSSKANPDEVHVTIRAVRYEANGRERFGVCSVHSAERLLEGDKIAVYINENPNFKLPADPEAPIIMIGPGTGVAPFRSFLQEREETGAAGKSWLFYGDQHFLTDFLYQIEWQKWLKEGTLTRMDVAFSRDTDRKVYVQHRMLEKSRELYEWLQQGAYVYVCGDEKHMAHDVHATLGQILQSEGGLSAEQAAAYLTDLQQQKRYQRDVY
ncbi:assimilatory sulfite reductase (NADPH) flavoprotein subunit [Paenibacillus cymbidii]|uniref:assimilatory sulfite reductase (NADPH) flavoprotein subunit n=1 Tax=Paenibacillus cymbidii TaxID=1639034 RepID=UPI00108130CE|nr:assimilatory sulfite reductase (NADPH) flavoprotein subunit [Paenibacillus cymbidii]